MTIATLVYHKSSSGAAGAKSRALQRAAVTRRGKMEDTFNWMTGYLVRGLEPQFYLGVSIVMGIPLCRRENPTKMDDLGVPPFQETSI